MDPPLTPPDVRQLSMPASLQATSIPLLPRTAREPPPPQMRLNREDITSSDPLSGFKRANISASVQPLAGQEFFRARHQILRGAGGLFDLFESPDQEQSFFKPLTDQNSRFLER